MYSIEKLKNGLTVLYVPRAESNSVTTWIMVPVGSRYESDKIAGISHFIEHMMFKGTKKRSNTLKLTREIDRLGAEYNAFTGKEYTGYYIKIDKDYLDKSLDILSDMLFSSLFKSTEMKKEKTVIVEEIKMYKDNPLMYIDSLFEDLLYFKTDLGRDIAGSESSVLNLDPQEVINFRDKHYCPHNMFLAVAGKIDDKVKTKIEKYFGNEKNKLQTKNTKQEFKKAVFGSEKKDKRIFIDKRKTDQAQLMLGFPAFKIGDKRNKILAVLNVILGGSMSSRLFIQIREKNGLAYFVRSGSENFRDTGYLYIRAGLDAKNINKAIAIIKKEIEKICKNGVSAKELSDAKTHIRGSLVLDMEDSSVEANYYLNQVFYEQKIKTIEEKLSEIDNVSNEDIIAIAKQIFKWNKIRIGLIADVEKKDIIF
ncbi:MAG: pitrilysin family protein [Patescibacteria group bacterium]